MQHTDYAEDLDLWLALMAAHSAVSDAIESVLLEKLALPLAWHEVLVRLALSDTKTMRMQELADAVHLSKSGLTRLCDRMEQAGLLMRESCPSDRRGLNARITPKGQEMFDRAAPLFFAAAEQNFVSHLTEEERTVIRHALRRVVEAHGAPGCWTAPEDVSIA